MDFLHRLAASRLAINLSSGAVFGFAAYHIINGSPAMVEPMRIAVCAGLMTFAFALMSLNGTVSLLRAVLSALGLGGLTAALFALGNAESLMGFMIRNMASQLLFAWAVLTFVPLPALRALGAGERGKYPALWAATLELLVAWGAGIGFVLLSWAVIVPAMRLLDMVGLPATHSLFADDWLPFVLSGVMMGGGFAGIAFWPLARAGEVLSRVIRLLAPPFLAVMVVFCFALLVNGRSGEVHLSTWLMSWSVVASALLVSSIAGPWGLLRPVGSIWTVVASGLILLMVPVAAAALWGAIDAFSKSGVTPEAIAEAALALFSVGLALGYGVLFLRAGSIGGANRIAVGLLFAWAVGLLSGILSPEALAVRHTLARLDRAEAQLKDLPLRSMAFYWGNPGKDGIEQLRSRFAQDPEALEYITSATQTSRPPVSLAVTPVADLALRVDFVEKIVALPRDSEAAADFVARWEPAPEALRNLLRACESRTPAGNPGCLLVAGDFLPKEPGEEILLLSLENGPGPDGRVTGWQRQGADQTWQPRHLIGDFYLFDAAATIDRLHQVGPVLRPVPLQALSLPDQDIFFRPHNPN